MSLYLTLSGRRAASASHNSFSDPFIRENYATPILRGHLAKEYWSAKLFSAQNEERDHVLVNDMKNNDIEFYLEKFLRN